MGNTLSQKSTRKIFEKYFDGRDNPKRNLQIFRNFIKGTWYCKIGISPGLSRERGYASQGFTQSSPPGRG
ncbi:hypothetical protein [Salinimicrobium sediminilitoris]|uniref:hypothetical protein n=1 Tax=Salinimicrobium sediminilitoris TaxID=2876715 RepID=UPI001E5929AA|nr:hypothetical protein [Salinimicrobium sediminilitoris]MCC8360256.1 hypothetical protein [Salinimicrobium sediminilitoris]